jgi:flavin reductase (DIM6/NTAB) family NADH-FMN oxidoreductase RutF
MEKAMSLAAGYSYTASPERFHPQIESAAFKNAMRFLAGAVSVITVGQGRDLTGFTATSVSSLSADHPSVIVSLNRSSSSWPVIQQYKSFCVNILADDQQPVADNFAGRGGIKGADRYEGASWQKLVTGSLGLVDALTVLDCELEEAIERHSHAILIGSVRAITTRVEAQPLLYWHGGYRQLSNQTGPGGKR